MISLIFTRKKLLVGISGKVTEFLEIDGSPFIEFGHRTPAEALQQNLQEILNEYRYYVNRNNGSMSQEVPLSILYPNDRPGDELAQIQEIIRRDGPSLSIVHIDSLVLPYLYGMSRYDEIISEPCIVLEALDNYISLLYFHNPKKVNGSFLPIEENNLPTEYLKEKLSPQRLEAMGINKVFLLGKYLYNDFVLDFLENDLSLGNFIVRRNTSHLTDYKFMIKGSQRRMKDFSINPSERLADWNKTLARIQIPVSKKDPSYEEPYTAPEVENNPIKEEDLSAKEHLDTNFSLTGKIDSRSLEINQEIVSHYSSQENSLEQEEVTKEEDSLVYEEPLALKEPTINKELELNEEILDLKEKIKKQSELYDKMAISFAESNRRAQESNLRVRETEGEIKRLKKILEAKEQEIESLRLQSQDTEILSQDYSEIHEELDRLKARLEAEKSLKEELEGKDKELQKLKSQIIRLEMLESSLKLREQEISSLKLQLENKSDEEAERQAERALSSSELSEQVAKVAVLEKELSDAENEIQALKARLVQAMTMETELATKEREISKLSQEQEVLKESSEELSTQIQELHEKVKMQEATISKKEEALAELGNLESDKSEIEKEKNSLKQELELLLSRYKIQQDLLVGKDQEFAEYKDNRIEADIELKKEINAREEQIDSLKEDIKNRQFKHNDELKIHLAEIDDLNSKVDAKEHKISKLGKEKEKLSSQISELEGNLNDRILELKAINVRLKVKELEVQELEHNLKSREDEIEDLGRKMVDKNNLISEKEAGNMKLKGDLNSIKDQLLALELALKKSEGTIRVKEDEIAILKKDINQQKLDAESLFASNEKQQLKLEDKIKNLQDVIASGNEKIGQLETTIRQKEKEVQEQVEKYKIEKEAKQILSDKLLVANKDKDALKAELKERSEELDRALPELEKSKIRLLDLSSVIENQRVKEGEHKTQIVDQQKKIGDLEKVLAGKSTELKDLKDLFIKSENELNATKEKLDEHAKAIVNLNKTVETKESSITDLENKIKEADDEIIDLKAKLDLSTSRWADIGLALKGRDEHIIQLEDELTSLREVKKVLSSDLEQVNFELNDAKAKLEVYIAERNVAEARANELSLQVKRMEVLSDDKLQEDESISHLQTTIRNLNKDLTERDDKLQKYRTELGHKEKELDQIKKQIEAHREDLAKAKSRLAMSANGRDADASSDLAAMETKLNIMKVELQAKDKELRQLNHIRGNLRTRISELESSQTDSNSDNKFQKMIEGKNEVIRALKIKLSEKDKEFKQLSQAQGTLRGKEQLVASKEAKKFIEKLRASEMARQRLAEELKRAQAQLEDQEALRNKLIEMEREMVVQRGRTKSRLEALEAELAKAFDDKDMDSNSPTSFDRFQKTV